MKISIYRVFLFFCFLVLMKAGSAQDVGQDFSAIDKRAQKSPKQLQHELPELTAYLTGETNTDLEKVRGIYVWITTHINYDWKAAGQDKRINHSIKDILDRKLAVCFGYAQLFHKMCELAGLESALVHGYGKGTATTQLPFREPNHSWNAVRIDGTWYLLDATWGSSSISKNNDFVLTTNDDYFLIRPEKFVLTHLPGNPIWQLLSDPVPTDIFMQSDSAVMRYLDQAGDHFAFQDSLDALLSLPPALQRLKNYQYTYRSYPTPENGEQLGHALIDYAGILSDSLDSYSKEDEWESILHLNDEIIRHCRKAKALITFYPWQLELFVNTLINQAVFQYNWQDELDDTGNGLQEDIIDLLLEARQLLETSRDSPFSRMARQQCENYIEVVKNQ